MKRRSSTSMGKRASTRKKSPAKKRKKKPQSSNLRQTLYSLGLWGLGLVNALMIASFIHKHISTGNEQVLSLEEPVRQQQSAPIPRAKSAVAPQAARLKLEILNGCGAQGIANKFAQYLRQAGFQPVNVGNFDNFDMPNTLILDRKSRNRHLGLQVAESLGLPSSFVRYLAKDNARVDVTVIIGKDYPKIDFLQAKK